MAGIQREKRVVGNTLSMDDEVLMDGMVPVIGGIPFLGGITPDPLQQGVLWVRHVETLGLFSPENPAIIQAAGADPPWGPAVHGHT
jgi:hypothetical protein